MGNVGFEIEVRNCCLKKDNKTKLVDGYKLGSIYIDSVTKGKNIISVEVEGEKVLSQNPYLELVTNVFENTDQCIKSLKRVVRFQEDLSLDEKLSNVTLKKNRGNFSVVQVNFDFPFVELYSSTFASSFTKFQEIKNKIDAYTKLKDKNVSIKSYLSYWIYKAKFYCRHDVQFLMEDKMPRGYDFRGDKKVKGKNLGGEDCEIKTNFEFLIKASDVDLLEIIGQDNRSTIENIFIDSDIVKKIYYIASADEKTNTDVIDKYIKHTLENIKTLNNKGDMFYFDEPRLSAMLKVQGNNVVIEQRKEKTQNTETDIKEKVQKYLQHADKQTENDVRKLLNNYFDGKYKNI